MAGLLTKAYREQVLHETPQTKRTQAKQQNRNMEMEQAVRERQQTRERWELSSRGGSENKGCAKFMNTRGGV